ncbi:MAG: TonB-dependent receptor [Candidatus Binatia bacterium]|nr:TonB-dependent receptor [Candidatus Binatia bacterium]
MIRSNQIPSENLAGPPHPAWFLLPIALCASVWGVQARAQGASGQLSGVVRDQKTKEAIIDAGVEIVGAGKQTRTDLDGRFSFTLPEGRYEVRVFAPFYRSVRIQNLVVTAGQKTETTVELPPETAAATETVEVVARADRGSARVQLALRKEAASVTENISAQEIRTSPDSDAGEIVQRLPAVVVKDDKYMNVRGLNERYSTARLQGSRLPSTDPERRVVPLDLFPAEFIEAISLVKTFQPDLPGDFSGALADIFLKSFPERPSFNFGVQTGANTNSTFRTFDTYRAAGPADYFGLGEHFRRLPDLIPDTAAEVNRTPARAQAFARAFDNIWEPSRISAPPNLGFNFSGGGTFGPVGISLAGLYRTEYKRQNLLTSNVLFAGDKPEFADRFDNRVSAFDVRLGGLLNSAYRFNEEHNIFFRALVNRNASDETRRSIGVEDSTGHTLAFTRFRYTVDTLAFGQLGGEHRIGTLKSNWRTAYGYTTQDQPDGRLQTRDLTEGNIFINNNFGGRRLFGFLEERLTDSAVDFELRLPQPRSLSPGEPIVRFGPAYTFREREQGLRQFIFDVKDVPELQSLPAEQIFAAQNLGPNPFNRGVGFREESKPRDSFRASEELLAGYGALELPVFQSAPQRHEVVLYGGARAEYWHLNERFFGANGKRVPLSKTEVDPLPALGLRYRPFENFNLRLSWSETRTRPDLRELSPTQYPEQGSLETKAGDPTLKTAAIRNYDVRCEWFPSDEELLSASAFYKEFTDPIEQVIFYEGANRVFKPRNALSAKVLGAEFEARLALRRAWSRLDGLSFLGNLTWVDSEAKILQESGLLRSRALQGQAPFIVNTGLSYRHTRWGEVRLLYNTAGRRVEAAAPPDVAPGTSRPLIPEVYEERRDQLDAAYLSKVHVFTVPLQLKVTAENLLNDQYVFTQADLVQKRFTTGVKVSFSMTYAF